jgi:hypothetical protein
MLKLRSAGDLDVVAEVGGAQVAYRGESLLQREDGQAQMKEAREGGSQAAVLRSVGDAG